MTEGPSRLVADGHVYSRSAVKNRQRSLGGSMGQESSGGQQTPTARERVRALA